MKQEYLNCGFNDYLSKPIERPELERVIKEYISKKRSTNANTDLSKSANSILEKEYTIDLPVLAQNTSEIPKTSDVSTKKVLVVDDNEMNLKIAINALKKYNLDIESVSSGSEAISKVIENKYDLIFLDEMMPELDGCKTLENFREIDGFNTPTIMMTASPQDEVQDKINQYKFDGYLSKPFKKEDLDKVMSDLLK
jgi:CheY-like chemotaxis protein